MPNPPRDSGTAATPKERFPAGGRSSLVALAFVALCLLAQGLAPSVMLWRVDRLRAETDARTAQIADSLPRFVLLFNEIVIAHQSVRVGDADAVARYRALAIQERAAVEALVALAPQVSPAAVRHARELRRWNEEWVRQMDDRAEGRATEPEFVSRFGQMSGARDSTRDRLRDLGMEVERVDAALHAEGGRLINQMRQISTILGVIGILAIMAVAWAAQRERRLTRALHHSLEQEAHLRREAERSRADLQAVSESKARLMRGFGHDVKNPLGAADGFLQLMEDGVYGEIGEKPRHSVVRARASLGTALDLIEDLLEIARAETGNIIVEQVPTDVCGVVRSVVQDYLPQAESKGLDLSGDCPEDLPTLRTDPVRLRQVVGNLVSNAVKYTPSGSVQVEVRLRETDGAREGIAVDVIDTGSGIPPEKRHLLFQEFVRFEPGVAKGTGIGLAFSARVVEALGGTLSFDGERGQGSRFTLWLPFSEEP